MKKLISAALLLALLLVAVAAQVGGYSAEQHFSNMFSSGVKASSSVCAPTVMTDCG